jgi:hypothetical protein
MQVKLKVFSAEKTVAAIPVTLPGGIEATANVDSLVVQLVDETGPHGTAKLVFIGDELAQAKDIFVAGSNVSVTFAKE